MGDHHSLDTGEGVCSMTTGGVLDTGEGVCSMTTGGVLDST